MNEWGVWREGKVISMLEKLKKEHFFRFIFLISAKKKTKTKKNKREDKTWLEIRSIEFKLKMNWNKITETEQLIKFKF